MTKIKSLIKFVEVAYKVGTLDLDESKIPENYNLILKSSDIADRKTNYSAIAIINEEKKEIVVACAGTRINLGRLEFALEDLQADFELFCRNVPSKFKTDGMRFIDEIMNNINNPEEYKYVFTGHSLGAIMADLSAYYFSSKYDCNKIESVTFDSPGSLEILKNFQKSFNIEGNPEEAIEFTSIKNSVNFINSTNSHIGEVLEIMPSDVAYQQDKSVGFVGKVFNYLGLGSIYSQISQHYLSSFHDSASVEKMKPIKLDRDYNISSSKRALEYDEDLFHRLVSLDCKIGPYFMIKQKDHEEEDFVLVDLVGSCGRDDIVVARHTQED